MKLNLTNLIENEKLVSIASPKTGMRKKDSLYFDFDKKLIYIHSDFIIANIKFDYKLESSTEVYYNTFFDTNKLFIILKNLDASNTILKFEGDSNKKPTFHSGKDKYTIEHLLDEEKEEDFEIEFESNISFIITDEIVASIKEAQMFVDQTKDNMFNAVALTNKGIYGVTPARFYEYKTDLFSEKLQEGEDIKIHRDIAKFISFLSEGVNVDYAEGRLRFYQDTFDFIFAIPYQHTIVPSDKDIEGVISTDTYVEVNNKFLFDNIKFFDPFYSIDSKPIKIKILSETEIELSTVSDFDIIKKIIPVDYVSSEIIGFEAEYNGEIIKLALSTLNDFVHLYFDREKIGVGIFNTDNTNKMIAIMKYADTE